MANLSTKMRFFCVFVFVLMLQVVAVVKRATANASAVCEEIKTCFHSGDQLCDRRKEKCPPCLYPLADKYACWPKDPSTNTCPFTGVKADCSSPAKMKEQPKSEPETSVDPASMTPKDSASSTKSENNESNTNPSNDSGGRAVIIAFCCMGSVLVLALFFAVRRRRATMRNQPQIDPENHPWRKIESNSPRVIYKFQEKQMPPPARALRVNDFVHAMHEPKYNDEHRPDHRPVLELAPPLFEVGERLRATSSGTAAFRGTEFSTMSDSSTVNVLDEYLKAKKQMDDLDGISELGRSTRGMSLESHTRDVSLTDSEYVPELKPSFSEYDSDGSYNEEMYGFAIGEEDQFIMLEGHAVQV